MKGGDKGMDCIGKGRRRGGAALGESVTFASAFGGERYAGRPPGRGDGPLALDGETGAGLGAAAAGFVPAGGISIGRGAADLLDGGPDAAVQPADVGLPAEVEIGDADPLDRVAGGGLRQSGRETGSRDERGENGYPVHDLSP